MNRLNFDLDKDDYGKSVRPHFPWLALFLVIDIIVVLEIVRLWAAQH